MRKKIRFSSVGVHKHIAMSTAHRLALSADCVAVDIDFVEICPKTNKPLSGLEVKQVFCSNAKPQALHKYQKPVAELFDMAGVPFFLVNQFRKEQSKEADEAYVAAQGASMRLTFEVVKYDMQSNWNDEQYDKCQDAMRKAEEAQAKWIKTEDWSKWEFHVWPANETARKQQPKPLVIGWKQWKEVFRKYQPKGPLS